MLIELDILGKKTDSLLVEETIQTEKPSEPKKPEGFVYEEPMLQIVTENNL